MTRSSVPIFRSLYRSVAISAGAYALVSAVSLVLTPLLIARYGLAGFGQVVIARLFVPNAMFGLLDIGASEITTQTIARARQDDDWSRAWGVIGLLTLVNVGIGAIAGVILFLAAGHIPGWMGVAMPYAAGLATVLRTTALCLPVLFFSLILEGLAKGFERFGVQRGSEVVAGFSYGILAVLCIVAGLDVDAVCYALLISLFLKLVMLIVAAVRQTGTARIRVRRWDASDIVFVRKWAGIMSASKVLGAFQTQVAPPLIGLMFGPAAVGAVDALSRLPRFVKSTLSLLNSTVLPFAASMEFGDRRKDLEHLGRNGIIILALITLPPIAAAISFSEPLTRLWLGPSLADHWYWGAMLFLFPASNTLTSFGSQLLLVRSHVAVATNRIILAQIVIQLALALALAPLLAQWSFILGQVVAICLTSIIQMRLIGRELGFDRHVYRPLLATAAVLLAMIALTLPFASYIRGVAGLLIFSGIWVFVSWLIASLILLTRVQRLGVLGSVGRRLQKSHVEQESG